MTIDPADVATIVDRLSRHDRLRNVPRAELEWLAAHGTPRGLAIGELVARIGEPRSAYKLYVVLSGRLSTYVPRGRVRRKMREVRGGEFAGMLPFSRMTHSTADVVVDEPTDVLQIDLALFPELIRECPGVTAACVHSMLDRAHAATESELHDEKMVSLGKLAAGLAHELNNPASAALRGVQSLAARQLEIETALDALAANGLSEAQRNEVRAVRDSCLLQSRSDDSPLARADREDAIAQWLEARGVDAAAAASLVDACITIARLNALAGALPTSAFGPAIDWLAASIGARTLLADIAQSLTRIHHLIGAVKGFTQMDRPLVAEPTSIGAGLRDAVSVMSGKARTRSVLIDIDVPDELPLVNGSAGDLNQAWACLLDNALDAAPTSSRVTISARTVGSNVVVSVVDRGAGVPEHIRGQIFDPFFTTKPIGEGRGLGLDITRRIVSLVDGHVDFDSVAGRTEFRVSLPIAEPVAAIVPPTATE